MMESLIKPYLEHLTQNPNSLLARIYGLFTIKTKYFKMLHVMVMQNTFIESNDQKNAIKFDLKGSRDGRKAKNVLSKSNQTKVRNAKTENEFFKYFRTKKILKDIDFIQINESVKRLQLQSIHS